MNTNISKFNDNYNVMLESQVNADDLPPGEYEILAMFDGNDGAEGVPKPVGPPRDRVDAGKSLSQQVQIQLKSLQL